MEAQGLLEVESSATLGLITLIRFYCILNGSVIRLKVVLCLSPSCLNRKTFLLERCLLNWSKLAKMIFEKL